MADDAPQPTMSGVAHLTDEQVAELKKTFMLFDRNGDGSITIPELGTAMRSLGMAPTEAELKDLVATIDTDENGNIEYQEFLTLMAKKLKELESPETLINAFKVFDKEDSGYISVAEFRHLMTNLGDEKQPDEVVDDMIKMADVDESGQIQYIKFVHTMLEPNQYLSSGSTKGTSLIS